LCEPACVCVCVCALGAAVCERAGRLRLCVRLALGAKRARGAMRPPLCSLCAATRATVELCSGAPLRASCQLFSALASPPVSSVISARRRPTRARNGEPSEGSRGGHLSGWLAGWLAGRLDSRARVAARASGLRSSGLIWAHLGCPLACPFPLCPNEAQ